MKKWNHRIFSTRHCFGSYHSFVTGNIASSTDAELVGIEEKTYMD